MIILGVISFLIVLAIDLITDYKRWLKQRIVNHKRGAWIRAVALIPSMIFLHLGNPFHNTKPIELVVLIILMEFFVWWLIFDGCYNLLRGDNFWAIKGTTAALDKFQQTIGPFWTWIIKLGFSISFLIVYIITLVA